MRGSNGYGRNLWNSPRHHGERHLARVSEVRGQQEHHRRKRHEVRAQKKKLTVETRRRELVVATLEAIRKHGYMNATIKTISEEIRPVARVDQPLFRQQGRTVAVRLPLASMSMIFIAMLSVPTMGGIEKLLAAAYVPFLQTQPYAEIWVHFWSASRMLPQVRAMHQALWGRYRRSVERRMTAVARERGLELDIAEATLMYTQLIDGLWVGLFMEEAFDAETCRRLLRNWLCGLFNELPENHPVSPEIEMATFTTEAPL